MKICSKLSMIKGFLVALLLVSISCDPSTIQIDDEEGFLSSTGNHNQIIKGFHVSSIQPELHLHFDAHIKKEDMQRMWNEAVKNYTSKLNTRNKGFSTEWFYTILTSTGTQTNNGTDGHVGVYTFFNTSKGKVPNKFVWLDNPGNDREGGNDLYLIRASFPREAVEWVEIDGAQLYLYGMDGWFIKEFWISIQEKDQTVPASGNLSDRWYPNIWLDNDTPNGWDNYYAPKIGTAKIRF